MNMFFKKCFVAMTINKELKLIIDYYFDNF